MLKILAVGALVFLTVSSAVSAQDTDTESVKPALLVIDIQNKFIPMMDQSEVAMALRMINGAIWQFREHELPVIRVYHTDPSWGPEPGTEDFEFPESTIIQEDDPKIVKNFPSAFVKTDLDTILKEKGVNTVFLCGLSATHCVLATYFGAMERDYNAFMVEGALMSAKAEHTDMITDVVESVGWEGLGLILKVTTQ